MKLINSYVKSKTAQFCTFAKSAWTQKEAEKIWSDSKWKLGLEFDELVKLEGAWATFVVKGDASELERMQEVVEERLK